MEKPDVLPSGQARIESMEMRGITKCFPGVLANDHIDFDVKSGEVHALLGENGAGKSTLMKILYGIYHQDEGEIFINKKPVNINSPKRRDQRKYRYDPPAFYAGRDIDGCGKCRPGIALLARIFDRSRPRIQTHY